jgi:threonylcarbamoyladenosine tRNA methylthiotransferase MtaB
MTRVAVLSFGCKLNLHEGELLAKLLPGGFEEVPWDAVADVYVVNTCTVTARADMRARGAVRSAHRRNPAARVVVTGCSAQTDPAMFAAMPEVTAVVGNHEKSALPELLERMEAGEPIERVQVSRIWSHRTLDVPLTASSGRSRPFVKIQDGCNEICSFCKIPFARGRSRSSPPARIAEQVRALVAAGFQEVVLTGVHMGCWGEDLAPPVTLPRLLEELLALDPHFRIRLSSIEPNHLTDELVELIAREPRVCPHLHLPMQSGDDGVLAAMRRRYSAAGYSSVVEGVAARLPDACLGADVIVGFPGETDAAFAATVARIRALPLAYLHVFPYSERTGTLAASLPAQVPGPVRAERSRHLTALSNELWARHIARHVGRTVPAIALAPDEGGEGEPGTTRCVTAHYVDVRVPASDLPRGRLVNVRITESGPDEAVGLIEPA